VRVETLLYAHIFHSGVSKFANQTSCIRLLLTVNCTLVAIYGIRFTTPVLIRTHPLSDIGISRLRKLIPIHGVRFHHMVDPPSVKPILSIRPLVTSRTTLSVGILEKLAHHAAHFIPSTILTIRVAPLYFHPSRKRSLFCCAEARNCSFCSGVRL